MCAAVDHVEHGYRQHVGVGTTDGAVERQLEIAGRRPGHRQRGRHDGVGPEPSLVRRPVQVDHGQVDAALVEGVEADQDLADLAVDVLDRPSTPRPPKRSPPSRRSTASSDAGGRPGGDDGPAASARVELDLHLDRRVAPRVEHLPADDVLDGAHESAPRAPSLARR